MSSHLQLRILTEEGGKDDMGAAPDDQFDDVFLRRIEGSMLSQVALQVRASAYRAMLQVLRDQQSEFPVLMNVTLSWWW